MARPGGYDYLVKLLVIGDSGVGKTCLLLRFSDDNFTTNHITTIGIDFKIKTITVDSKNIKLQVWDTAGQERFRTITQTYYKGAMGIILAYDCTQEETFQNIQNWMEQIDKHAHPGVKKVLIGNKCDLPEKKISYEEGKKLADSYGIQFFETSAKNNINVTETFYHLAKEIKDSKFDEMGGKNVELGKAPKKEKKKCC